MSLSQSQSCEDAIPNYERKLMEKDKAFFDLSRNYKTLENEKEAIENKSKAQECEILNLKNELSSVQSTIKIKDNKLEAKEDKIRKLTLQIKTREAEFDSLTQAKDKKLNEISNAFTSHIKEYEGVIIEAKKIEEHNNKIANEMNDKDNMIKSLQSVIFELKKENKQIYTLNKLLSEKEEKVDDLTQQNNQLSTQCNDLQNEITQLNIQKTYTCSSERSYSGMNSPIRTSASHNNNNTNNKNSINEKILMDLQTNFKGQIEQKDKYYNELNGNYKNALKENEKLIQFTISQIKLVEKSLEMNIVYNSNNNYMSTISSIDHMSDRSHHNNPYHNQHSLKYELITKNFELINKKIHDRFIADSQIVQQCQVDMSEYEEKNKELLFTIEKLRQEKASIEAFSNKVSDELKEKKMSFDDVDVKYNELYHRCNSIEDILNESNEKYAHFEAETNDFCNRCLKLVNDFLSNDSLSDMNKSSNDIKLKQAKIIDSFAMIIKALNKQNSKEAEYIKSAQLLNSKIEKLSNANDQLYQQYENIVKGNKIKSESQEDEFKKQKGILITKMNELSDLLKESNNMLHKYEEENSIIKTKNSKLEHNLQMLTCSHSEMEKAIEKTDNMLKEVIKQKEYKNNTLIRELELKDIQITSLEKLVHELKTNDIRNDMNSLNFKATSSSHGNAMKGKLISKSQYKSLLLKKNNDDSFQFVPNEQNEKELQQLFQHIPLETNEKSQGGYPRSLNESVQSNHNNLLGIDTDDAKINNSFHTAPLNKNMFYPHYTNILQGNLKQDSKDTI